LFSSRPLRISATAEAEAPPQGRRPPGEAVGGEQLPVVEQVDHNLCGGAPGGRAVVADHGAGLVAGLTPVRQVGGAAILVYPAEAADASPGEPVQPSG
jgi:hypothetical protein